MSAAVLDTYALAAALHRPGRRRCLRINRLRLTKLLPRWFTSYDDVESLFRPGIAVMRYSPLIALALAAPLHAEQRDGDPARGKAALEGRSFNPPVWTMSGYESLWKQWGLREKP